MVISATGLASQNRLWFFNTVNQQIGLYDFNKNTRLITTIFYGKYYSDMSGSVNESDFYNRTYKSTTDFTYRKSEALRTRLTLEHDWNDNGSSYITACFYSVNLNN